MQVTTEIPEAQTLQRGQECRVLMRKMGKLKYVSVERRAESGERRAESGERRAESGERRLESGKYRFCWVILGEAVPISVELEIV
jgi:hypothetical protein